MVIQCFNFCRYIKVLSLLWHPDKDQRLCNCWYIAFILWAFPIMLPNELRQEGDCDVSQSELTLHWCSCKFSFVHPILNSSSPRGYIYHHPAWQRRNWKRKHWDLPWGGNALAAVFDSMRSSGWVWCQVPWWGSLTIRFGYTALLWPPPLPPSWVENKAEMIHYEELQGLTLFQWT